MIAQDDIETLMAENIRMARRIAELEAQVKRLQRWGIQVEACGKFDYQYNPHRHDSDFSYGELRVKYLEPGDLPEKGIVDD